jgi:serine/threonine protein kinase
VTTSYDNKESIAPGTVLKGKWNGKSYRIERLLGFGANGQVYLAANGRAACAVKLGQEASELQGEANALALLDGREKGRPPFLLDVDDCVLKGANVPFYVMKYVPGLPVKTYLRQFGAHWFGVVGYRLLNRLADIHEAGFVFGDIKNDNVLVTEYGRTELVDYGGMTAIGRSVRQFTEIYDRGFWSAGSRTADPAYDWFAAAMLWLHVLEGKRLLQLTRTLLPQNRHTGELMLLVNSNAALRPMAEWMERAFAGHFRDSREACSVWRSCLRRAELSQTEGFGGVPGWMAGLLAVSVVLCASAAALWLLD